MDERIAKLSPRERECLRLVPRLRTSKAISIVMQVQPDTVDQYIKRAMAKLAAADRFVAAEMLAADEVEQDIDPSHPSGHRMAGLAATAVDAPSDGPLATDGTERLESLHEARSDFTYDHVVGRPGRRFPDFGQFLRSGRSHNDLTTVERLTLTLKAGVYFTLLLGGFAVVLLVFAAVSRELHHL
jgi:DNA-binding CsgD family transcriptional regulator